MENKKTDVEKNKWMGVLAYFIFFIPLLADSNSEFGKFHANQGLNLLLLFIAVSVLGSIVPLLGWFIILPFGSILNAINEKQKELPIIGKIKLIK
jgi:uncharacterized membrane protein